MINTHTAATATKTHLLTSTCLHFFPPHPGEDHTYDVICLYNNNKQHTCSSTSPPHPSPKSTSSRCWHDDVNVVNKGRRMCDRDRDQKGWVMKEMIPVFLAVDNIGSKNREKERQSKVVDETYSSRVHPTDYFFLPQLSTLCRHRLGKNNRVRMY